MSILIGGNARQREEHRRENEARHERQLEHNERQRREDSLEAEVNYLRAKLMVECPTCHGDGEVLRTGDDDVN